MLTFLNNIIYTGARVKLIYGDLSQIDRAPDVRLH